MNGPSIWTPSATSDYFLHNLSKIFTPYIAHWISHLYFKSHTIQIEDLPSHLHTDPIIHILTGNYCYLTRLNHYLPTKYYTSQLGTVQGSGNVITLSLFFQNKAF